MINSRRSAAEIIIKQEDSDHRHLFNLAYGNIGPSGSKTDHTIAHMSGHPLDCGCNCESCKIMQMEFIHKMERQMKEKNGNQE